MFIIDFLKYDIVGKYYFIYLIIGIIILLAFVGLIADVEIKRKSEIYRIRREKKAEEETKKAEENLAKGAQFNPNQTVADPTYQQAVQSQAATPVAPGPVASVQAVQAPVAQVAQAPAVEGVPTNPTIGEKPEDNVLVID